MRVTVLRRSAVVVGALTLALGGAGLRGAVAAGGGGGQGPPYQAGPQGGDQFNVVQADPSQGRITIARAYPEPGAFNCAGNGGYAYFLVRPTLQAATSSVSVGWDDQTAFDSYTWVDVFIRDASGTALGSGQVRGPVVGAGSITVPLSATQAVGSVISVEFGLLVASACPNVDGGSVHFTSVSVGGGGVGGGGGGLPPIPSAPGGVSGAGAAAVSVANFEYIPGDTDLSQAPLQITSGMGLVLVNADATAPHTLTADQLGPDGKPLFDSGAPVNAGGVAGVAGVADLVPGTYTFHCSVHTQMHGVLTVLAGVNPETTTTEGAR